MVESKQTQAWMSGFGVEYTDRNCMTLEEMDEMYKKDYGISRTNMDDEFLSRLDRDMKVLEVGANIGLQLRFLMKMGFKRLYGLDVSRYAVDTSKETLGIDIIEGSALDIPFKDNFFDMVFTSGVLIHINPNDINIAIGEICRCSSKYIWGFEYYSEEYKLVEYRKAEETDELLWNADFPKLFMEKCFGLVHAKTLYYNYMGDKNKRSVMYLLEKGLK